LAAQSQWEESNLAFVRAERTDRTRGWRERSLLHRKSLRERGIGWSRTNCHPVNNRPLDLMSFDPSDAGCRHPAAVGGRAFTRISRVPVAEHARAREVGCKHPGPDQPGRGAPCGAANRTCRAGRTSPARVGKVDRSWARVPFEAAAIRLVDRDWRVLLGVPDAAGAPSSHPPESNRNLAGFSRARRPPTREWDSSSLFSCQRVQVSCRVVFAGRHGAKRQRCLQRRNAARAARSPGGPRRNPRHHRWLGGGTSGEVTRRAHEARADGLLLPSGDFAIRVQIRHDDA
jgi:hypothetical protein